MNHFHRIVFICFSLLLPLHSLNTRAIELDIIGLLLNGDHDIYGGAAKLSLIEYKTDHGSIEFLWQLGVATSTNDDESYFLMAAPQLKLSYQITKNCGVSFAIAPFVTNTFYAFFTGEHINLASMFVPSLYYVNDQGNGTAINFSFIKDNNDLATLVSIGLLKQSPTLSVAVIGLDAVEQQRVEQYFAKEKIRLKSFDTHQTFINTLSNNYHPTIVVVKDPTVQNELQTTLLQNHPHINVALYRQVDAVAMTSDSNASNDLYTKLKDYAPYLF